MKVDLVYPKIPDSRECPLKKCWAFEKYDGTNLHWVWDSDFGWYAFGTRRTEFDLDDAGIAQFNSEHPGLEDAAKIFKATLAEPLDQLFRDQVNFKVILFTEYLGTRSFAGQHVSGDPKQLVLLDVQVERDFVQPEDFIRDYAQFNPARLVYQGKYSGQLVEDVRKGKFNVAEGVVIKGQHEDERVVVKVKTDQYLAKLKQIYKDQWSNYWE